MTCIVGLEHKNCVYLGCDSANSDMYYSSTFGYTTLFHFTDLLQYEPSQRIDFSPRCRD